MYSHLSTRTYMFSDTFQKSCHSLFRTNYKQAQDINSRVICLRLHSVPLAFLLMHQSFDLLGSTDLCKEWLMKSIAKAEQNQNSLRRKKVATCVESLLLLRSTAIGLIGFE